MPGSGGSGAHIYKAGGYACRGCFGRLWFLSLPVMPAGASLYFQVREKFNLLPAGYAWRLAGVCASMFR